MEANICILVISLQVLLHCWIREAGSPSIIC